MPADPRYHAQAPEPKSGIQPNVLTKEPTYCAVIIPETEPAYITRWQSAQGLADELKRHYGTKTAVFPFIGWPWAISKGPLRRFLLGPAGERFPLFPDEVVTEIDPHGSLSTSAS